MKGVLLCCTLMFVALGANGQTARAYEAAAKSAFESKDYFAAMKYYEQSLNIGPVKPEVMYRCGESAMRFGALYAAEKQFEQLAGLESAANFQDLAFKIARVKKSLSKYSEALEWFQKYLDQGSGDQALEQSALRELDECEWALEQISTPDVTTRIERLPATINSPGSEIGAFQSDDGLVFASFQSVNWGDKRKPQRPLLRLFEGKDGMPPLEMAAFNHPKRHTAHLSLSDDGNMAVFNYCDYTGTTDIRCGLYMSYFDGNNWSEPKALPKPVNSGRYTATQPTLARDSEGNQVLYFVSDRPGGAGKLDIWYCTLDASGNAGAIQNLEAINTPEDDCTPYFSQLENTLYFSSEGYFSLGGFDVYSSTLEGGKWSQIYHLPVPVNSSFNELYYRPVNREVAYFSSNRIGSENLDGEACCFDIYKAVKLPIHVECATVSEYTGEGLADVTYTLVSKDGKLVEQWGDASGEVQFELEKEQQYQLIASRPGYISDTIDFSSDYIPVDRIYHKRMRLKPEITLVVKTYNQLSEQSLAGVAVRMVEVTGYSREINTGRHAVTNASVDFKKGYMLIAEKEGYFPDTLYVDEETIKNAGPGGSLDKHFFMTPSSLHGYLPLALYFDNDQPKMYSSVRSYEEGLNEYLNKKVQFIKEFTAGMDSTEAADATARLNQFFDEEVSGGFMKLEYFAENLDLFLSNGYEVGIMVKGFASPLANKEYNLALTKRRIASVRRYFRTYKNGKYAAFISSGQLDIVNTPLGESQSGESVSDSRKDRRLSVYSVEASLERRTEIIEVSLIKKQL